MLETREIIAVEGEDHGRRDVPRRPVVLRACYVLLALERISARVERRGDGVGRHAISDRKRRTRFASRQRLGPDRRNACATLTSRSNRTPMKQLLISSQFCGPQTTFFAGSGLNRLFAELSKCEIPTMRVPLGMSIGFAVLVAHLPFEIPLGP